MLASRASSAIFPNISFITSEGTETNAGLPSCRPRARVNSALVTGFGEVTLTGPEMLVRSSRNKTAARNELHDLKIRSAKLEALFAGTDTDADWSPVDGGREGLRVVGGARRAGGSR